MTRPMVIDARPRGPRDGPIAGEVVMGRPVLDHLLDVVRFAGPGEPVAIHGRLDEHEELRRAIDPGRSGGYRLVTGPPPEHAAILRADRLYDPDRLRRALRRGRDPETAVIWRLDQPRGLAGAEDELIRRRTYQPIGRFWALAPARGLARWLRPTAVRPNALTVASGGLMLAASALVACSASRLGAAAALALALVLDTSDGHLARLQGTASEFGRWLDANLDELGDMALHAATAWSCYARDGHPAWLVLGMVYAMGKYLYLVGATTGEALEAPQGKSGPPATLAPRPRGLRSLMILAGHADVRWHLWIVLAAIGRLDVALVAYALYFPARAIAGAARKAAKHA